MLWLKGMNILPFALRPPLFSKQATVWSDVSTQAMSIRDVYALEYSIFSALANQIYDYITK